MPLLFQSLISFLSLTVLELETNEDTERDPINRIIVPDLKYADVIQIYPSKAKVNSHKEIGERRLDLIGQSFNSFTLSQMYNQKPKRTVRL